MNKILLSQIKDIILFGGYVEFEKIAKLLEQITLLPDYSRWLLILATNPVNGDGIKVMGKDYLFGTDVVIGKSIEDTQHNLINFFREKEVFVKRYGGELLFIFEGPVTENSEYLTCASSTFMPLQEKYINIYYNPRE